ncbi:MAG: hypothetical protein WCA16_11685, partial [Candidatus Sulfotelmatobacter sp.]
QCAARQFNIEQPGVVRCENLSIVSDAHKPDYDICAQCEDANTIVLPTGEMYRVCAPSKWKSYECAAKQLVSLGKSAVPR